MEDELLATGLANTATMSGLIQQLIAKGVISLKTQSIRSARR